MKSKKIVNKRPERACLEFQIIQVSKTTELRAKYGDRDNTRQKLREYIIKKVNEKCPDYMGKALKVILINNAATHPLYRVARRVFGEWVNKMVGAIWNINDSEKFEKCDEMFHQQIGFLLDDCWWWIERVKDGKKGNDDLFIV